MRKTLLIASAAMMVLAFSPVARRQIAEPELSGGPQISPFKESRVVVERAHRKVRPTVAPKRRPSPAAPRVTTQQARRPARPVQALTALAWAESRAVSLSNASRTGAGEQRCTINSALARYARSHSFEMARRGRMYHSSSSQLWAACGSCSYVGEVVGVGTSIEQVHRAMMRSASHRATILNPRYRLIGAGVVKRGGWVYVTEVFAG